VAYPLHKFRAESADDKQADTQSRVLQAICTKRRGRNGQKCQI